MGRSLYHTQKTGLKHLNMVILICSTTNRGSHSIPNESAKDCTIKHTNADSHWLSQSQGCQRAASAGTLGGNADCRHGQTKPPTVGTHAHPPDLLWYIPYILVKTHQLRTINWRLSTLPKSFGSKHSRQESGLTCQRQTCQTSGLHHSIAACTSPSVKEP